MKIVPLSGVSRPAMSLKVVVLPQPLSPTMTREFLAIDREVGTIDRDDGTKSFREFTQG